MDDARRTTSGGTSLAEQLSLLARTLQHELDVDATLEAIVHAAVDTVPGAAHASISSIRKKREVHTRVATSDLPRALDEAQYGCGEGPCLDALYEQQTVRLPDLSDEQRWPAFTTRARQLGAGSMLAVQLYVEGDDLGALNLSSEQPHAFDDEAEHIALLFAAHAAVAMSDAQAHARLVSALTSRDLIGQAKGILMERFRLPGDEAFTLLVRASQATNRKVTDVADELVATGEMPAP